MIKFIVLVFIFFYSSFLKAEDSFLTLKQQLDRLQREVNDLSKSVFTTSRNFEEQVPKEEATTEKKISVSDLSAFDLRIYDLEKDIKKLNESLENITFQIDDIKSLYEKLDSDLSVLITNSEKIAQTNKLSQNENNQESESLEEENSLGTLVINSQDLSDNEDKGDQNIVNENLDINQEEAAKLSPEEEFQNAFDMLRNQKFDEAKNALQIFIENNAEDNLSGSAHYWLGEIYLLKKQYREAALILAEGYQKFPETVKAPDILYKLSESLVSIDKVNDACNTLSKLVKEYPKHKLINKTENKIISLDCPKVSE